MKRVITLCILSCLAGVTQAHEGAEGVIKERMDRFKENKESILEKYTVGIMDLDLRESEWQLD